MSLHREYKPYWEWEDWLNGMWRRLDKSEEKAMLELAINFTGDHMRYGAAMQEVIFEWPNTMLHNLTNVSINRKAFVGHCACQYKMNLPEYIVRMAWKELSDKQRYLANCQAELAINKWESYYEGKNKDLHQSLGVELLF